MKALKALLFIVTVGYILTEILIPYPRPNYKDPDLISKELVNGSFVIAMRDDISRFRAPGDRYAMSADELIARSLAREKTQPQYLSEDIEDYGPGGIKEMAWLPFYAEAGGCSPKVVYNPKRHYNDFEYIDENIVLDIPYTDGLYANITHYDENDPGLWGKKVTKDGDGNVVDCKYTFFSLKETNFRFFVDMPNRFCDNSAWIMKTAYVKGALVVKEIVSGSTFKLHSVDMQGNFHEGSELYKRVQPLGDFGYVAAVTEDGEKTVVLDTALDVVQTIGGDWATYTGTSMATGTRKYPFGTDVDGVLYFARDDVSSYKWTRTRNGVKVRVVKKPVWTYQVKTKYDYATNMFTYNGSRPKTLKYNVLRGCWQPKLSLPDHAEDDRVYFPGWDGYGDFAVVRKSDGTKTLYHTYDFKKWTEAAIPASYLDLGEGRIWFNGGAIGMVGFIPRYSMRVGPYGNDKMTLTLTGVALYYR